MVEFISAVLMIAAVVLLIVAWFRFPSGFYWVAGVICFVAARIIHAGALNGR